MEIFIDCGYDPDILGNNRIYGFARRLHNQIAAGKPLTEDYAFTKLQNPENTDYNTMQMCIRDRSVEIRISPSRLKLSMAVWSEPP